jgi:predicted nucleotidyltransferase
MNPMILIFALVVVIILYLGFKLMKSIIKTLFLFGTVLIVLIAIFGALAYLEVRQVTDPDSDIRWLVTFDRNNDFFMGFESVGLKLTIDNMLSAEQLQKIEDSYSTGDIKSILGDGYDYFIVFKEQTIEGQNPLDSPEDTVNTFNQGGFPDILAKIKDKTLEIYPKTILVRLLTFIPDKLVPAVIPDTPETIKN